MEEAQGRFGGVSKSLEMEATIEEVSHTNMERVVTMLGKTNQFNLTTHRHSRGHVETMLASPGSVARPCDYVISSAIKESSPSCSRFVVTMRQRW